jgi:hypothetical protein
VKTRAHKVIVFVGVSFKIENVYNVAERKKVVELEERGVSAREIL